MRRVLLTFVLILLAVSVSAFDMEELNIINFYNDTGSEIYYIFLSPGDSGYWGPELLGTYRTLENEESESYYIHYPEYCNTFDVMIIDENDNTYIVWDFEICDDEEAWVWIDEDDLDNTHEIPEFVNFTITNETSYEILSVFISPADSDMWGVDFLDYETTIQPGEYFEVLVTTEDTEIKYNVLSIDEDQDTYLFDYTLGEYDAEVAIDDSDYNPDY